MESCYLMHWGGGKEDGYVTEIKRTSLLQLVTNCVTVLLHDMIQSQFLP